MIHLLFQNPYKNNKHGIYSILINSTISAGTMFMPTITFWLLNALLLVVDTTGKPSFITRYRIQVDKNNPVGCVTLAGLKLLLWLLFVLFKVSIWKICSS